MEKKLSVVVSVYNEEQALPMFYETIKLILEILPWDYELLFVNDGSRDEVRTPRGRFWQNWRQRIRGYV
jgi:glycosyltransferase involved in cell wall biosynthesis